MPSFIIEGGHRLKGEITPQGAKNEALEVIAATLLTDEEVRISNIPDILDVNNLVQLLEDIGVSVTRHTPSDISFRAANINLDYLRSSDYLERCSRLRGSVLLIGPLLARFGTAQMAQPGGDKIGRRRLDTHLTGFQKLGAKFMYDEEAGTFNIDAKQLHGEYMLLDEASVTG
ncbi:MAG: UDP-N-acetylglucosamine 1-carboxyvinyltransferase, partial [Bacteroidales bacterium]|nr:UDP-N-acetylglucosamine 1-carboxyvinyltransferase [Candidatus Equimonas enterica]